MADKPKAPLKSVKGGRVTVRQRRGSRTIRVLFLTGSEAVNLDNGYRMELVKPLEVAVPEDALGYQSLEN